MANSQCARSVSNRGEYRENGQFRERCSRFPIRAKEWRLGDVGSLEYDYLARANGSYDAERLERAIDLWSQIVIKMEAFYVAFRRDQEIKMAKLNEIRERVGGRRVFCQPYPIRYMKH